MDASGFVLPPFGSHEIPVKGAGLYRGILTLSEPGQLSLEITSPRPLRLWVGRHLAVNDAPQRDNSHLFRILRLSVTLPVERGPHPIVLEVGERSRQIPFIDEHCPSRKRGEVETTLLKEFPEQIDVVSDFKPGQVGPALCLRFEPGQFRCDGMVWQDVWVRRIPGFEPLTTPWLGWGKPPPSWEPRLESVSCPTTPAHPVPLWEGRPNSEFRFYVPVMREDEEFSVRNAGKEPRSEPYRTVIGKIVLSVSDPSGTAVVAMPVMESVGKLAPKKHYSEVSSPDFDKVWAAVPKPILPEAWKDLERIYCEAWKLICRLWRPVARESGLPNGHVMTAETSFTHSLFVWDSCFTSFGYAYAWRAFPVYASLDCLYARQEDGGHIERHSDVRDNLPVLIEPGFGPNPPLMALAEWNIACLSGNEARLGAVYLPLKEHFLWLEANRRLSDGTYWTTGMASGLDNSPAEGDGYVDLTAQMAHFAEIMGKIAMRLRRTEESREWEQKRNGIAEAMNAKLWSERLGCFATSLSEGGHSPHKTATMFWPLWADVVSGDRVERLADMAIDPALFNRHHPFPTLAADSPLYNPLGEYWKGSVWVPTNFAALKGFYRVGKIDLAREFCLKHLRCLSEVFNSTGGIFWENYAPEKSTPGNASGRNFSWTTANPIALLFEILIGLEPDALENRLRWTLPSEDGIGVRNYPLGETTISLLSQKRGASCVCRVECNKPFTLDLVTPAVTRQIHCSVGTTYHEIAI